MAMNHVADAMRTACPMQVRKSFLSVREVDSIDSTWRLTSDGDQHPEWEISVDLTDILGESISLSFREESCFILGWDSPGRD
jgi:hypothetical protein